VNPNGQMSDGFFVSINLSNLMVFDGQILRCSKASTTISWVICFVEVLADCIIWLFSSIQSSTKLKWGKWVIKSLSSELNTGPYCCWFFWACFLFDGKFREKFRGIALPVKFIILVHLIDILKKKYELKFSNYSVY